MIKGKTRRGEDVWYIRDPKTGRYYPLRPGKEENHGWSCRNCSEKNTKRARIGQIKRSKRRAYLPKWYRREDKSFIPNAYDNHFDTCIPITVEEMIAEQLANGNKDFCVDEEMVENVVPEEARDEEMDKEVEHDEMDQRHDHDAGGNHISRINEEEQMNNSSEMVDGNAESDRFGDFDDVPGNSEIVQNGVARALLDGDNRVKLGVDVLDGFENAQNWNDLNEDGGDDDRFFDARESFEEPFVGDYTVNVEAVFGAEDFDMDRSGLNPDEFGGHSSRVGSRANSVELGCEEQILNGAEQVRESDFLDAVDHIDAQRFAVRADSGDDDEDYFVIDPRFYVAATPVHSNNGSLIHHAIQDRMMNIPSPIASPNLSGVASAHASSNMSAAAPAHLSTQVSIAGTSASTVSNSDVLLLGQPPSPAAPPADNDDEDSDHDPNEDFDWSRWTF